MAPDRYDRGSSRSRHGVWSHWVPLVLTLTIATAGAVAWAWSQRKDEEDDADEDYEPGLDYENADYGDNPAYGASDDRRPSQGPPGPRSAPDNNTYNVNEPQYDASNATWGARMSGALRRTPSPQQMFDSTGKTVAAGVAAAGAVMGKALASIREEDHSYGGKNPWSEEADAKNGRSGAGSSKKRKTVAIVVSADTNLDDLDDGGFHEHASILSHIPRHNDFSNIKLFVLIYAPNLKEGQLDVAPGHLPPPSQASSFSNIGHDQAQTPGEESKNPLATSSSTNAAFDAVYGQALSIVEKESMILPFTTPNGHVHILRHLQPEVIYLQESMSGDNGSIVANIQTWLRYDVILVVGAESGSGGLADSESEPEKPEKAETKWWQRPERVGRGRGVVVVDGMRVHDDWARRVQGKE